MVIDVHTHYQPGSVLPVVRPFGIDMRRDGDGSWVLHTGSVEYRLPGGRDAFWGSGLDARVREMDEFGVDRQVLQPSPMVFCYHLPADVGHEFARAFNDETARHIAAHPARFWGSAQLPMQDVDRATAELERAVQELGLAGCTVDFVLGPNRTLADPEYAPFLAAVEALDVPILLHPAPLGHSLDLAAGPGRWLLRHQLDWAWGYLFVETVAVAALILAGVLDRFPRLRVMVPHGGGAIPYQLGRLEEQARALPGNRLQRRPAEYLSQLYFDTVVHDPRALDFLIRVMGEDNVVLGTNYPGWDSFPGWEVVRSLPGIDDRTREKVLGGNAAHRLFRRPVPAGRERRDSPMEGDAR